MALTKARRRMIDGEVVNVRDFGAVGDNVADDTVAIQAAFDTGNHVVFNIGDTHKITNTLLLSTGGQQIIGNGSSLRITLNDGIGLKIFSVLRMTNVHVTDLEIISKTSTGTANTGVWVGGNCHHVKLERIFINHVAGIGLHVSAYGGGIAPYFSVYENVVVNTCTTGYYFHGGDINATTNALTLQTLINPYVLNCTGDAFYFNNVVTMSIINLIAESNGGSGYKLRYCRDVNLMGGMIENSAAGNIDLDEYAPDNSIMGKLSGRATSSTDPAVVTKNKFGIEWTGRNFFTAATNANSIGIFGATSSSYDITSLTGKACVFTLWSPYLNGSAMYGFGGNATHLIATWGNNTGQWNTAPGAGISVSYDSGTETFNIKNDGAYSTELYLIR
jgi:hypothetical protein